MKLVLHTNVISPHQIPLAKELVRQLGEDSFRYIYTEKLMVERQRMGWCASGGFSWIRHCEVPDDELESCEVLLSGIRDLDLFERRAQKGLKTFYMSERWFKPMRIGVGRLFRCGIPGRFRMLVPSYGKMARRFVGWVKDDSNARVFAIGPWAKKDMLSLGVPKHKIVPWGYFVDPSVQKFNHNFRHHTPTSTLKVLWAGRMLNWKRVDTIIRAVREVMMNGEGELWSVRLTLVGDGAEKKRLMRIAAGLPIIFLPSQPIDRIREIMRGHDVYVLSSNAQEGWGAVVNEALEEGLHVLGTYEAGSSAAMLSDHDLFRTGEFHRLAKLLVECARQKADGTLCGQGIGEWSAASASSRLLEVVGI